MGRIGVGGGVVLVDDTTVSIVVVVVVVVDSDSAAVGLQVCPSAFVIVVRFPFPQSVIV